MDTAIAKTRAPEAAPPEQTLGEVVLVERHEAGRSFVEMRDLEGMLLVEYEPATRRCRVRADALELHAEADLDLRAGGRVRIEGEEGVVLRAGESALEVGPESVGVVAARVETHARRRVEDLAQTKARRLRLVASDALRLLGRQAVLKAREDLKLRGERIYLE